MDLTELRNAILEIACEDDDMIGTPTASTKGLIEAFNRLPGVTQIEPKEYTR